MGIYGVLIDEASLQETLIGRQGARYRILPGFREGIGTYNMIHQI